MKPAAILTATGATILTAYVFRHQIAAAALGFLGLRMIYGAAKAKLGIRHRSRTTGLESARKWIETLGVGYIAARVPRAKRDRSLSKPVRHEWNDATPVARPFDWNSDGIPY